MNTHHRNTQTTNVLQKEPVITAAVSALIVKGIALAVEFGAPITEGQASAINAFSAALMVIIFILVRMFVTPTAKVLEQEQDGNVIAGEANEFKSKGEVIRKVGQLPQRPEA